MVGTHAGQPRRPRDVLRGALPRETARDFRLLPRAWPASPRRRIVPAPHGRRCAGDRNMSGVANLAERIAETLRLHATNDQMPSVGLRAGVVIPAYEAGVSKR